MILKNLSLAKNKIFYGLFYISLLSFNMSDPLFKFTPCICLFVYLILNFLCSFNNKNNINTIYIFIGLVFVLGTAFYNLLALIILISKVPINVYFTDYFTIIKGLFAVAIICGIYLPLYFKWGYDKTKILNLIVFLGVFTLSAIFDLIFSIYPIYIDKVSINVVFSTLTLIITGINILTLRKRET